MAYAIFAVDGHSQCSGLIANKPYDSTRSMCNSVVEHDYNDITHGQSYPIPYTENHVDADDDTDPATAICDNYAGGGNIDDYDFDEDGERWRITCW